MNAWGRWMVRVTGAAVLVLGFLGAEPAGAETPATGDSALVTEGAEHAGEEHAEVQAALKQRYPQLRRMRLHDKPVVALRVRSVSAWGNLDVDPAP